MSMRPPYRITGVLFILLAAFITRESLDLKFYTQLGPGPGFSPSGSPWSWGRWRSLWIPQAMFQRPDSMPAGFFASRAGYLRMGAIVLALTATTALMNVLGFRLTMLGVIIFLLYALGRQSLIVKLLVFGFSWLRCTV